MPQRVSNFPALDFDDRRIFRASRSSDLAAVSAIFSEASLSLHVPNVSPDAIAENVDAPLVHLCERGGEVVAVIQWRNLGEEAEILDLAVAKKHRRQGYGCFLLENFLLLARESGTGRIFLEVRESNTPAISLYRTFGFSAVGRRPNYYRHPEEAALLLRLELQASTKIPVVPT
jgi:[ribosomal protein S18]-alanine N-acetyltransferase